MRGRSALACLLALAAATGVAAAERKPDKRAEARVHYEAGIRKFDLMRYDEAADEFVQAYEIIGEPAILFNIAQSYRLGDRFEKSALFYRSFLRKMPELPNRAEIEGRIIEMEERGADQQRQAERRAAEERDAQRRGERRAERRDPDAATPKGPEPPPRNVAEPEPPRAGRGLKIAGYALCGVAGVGLAVGIAMTVVATRASHTVEDAATAGEVFTPGLRDTADHGALYDKLQIVGYAVGGAAAAAAAVTLVLGFRAERRGRETSGLRVAPGPGAAGLALAGRF